jgi:hypothetical protein
VPILVQLRRPRESSCLRASNADFECGRPDAVDPGHERWGLAASPNGRFVAATARSRVTACRAQTGLT